MIVFGVKIGTFAGIAVLGNVKVLVRQSNALILPNFGVCCIRKPHRWHHSIFIRNARGLLRMTFVCARWDVTTVTPPHLGLLPQDLGLPFSVSHTPRQCNPQLPRKPLPCPNFRPAAQGIGSCFIRVFFMYPQFTTTGIGTKMNKGTAATLHLGPLGRLDGKLAAMPHLFKEHRPRQLELVS